jgi:PAS domain-containing protein
MVSISLEGKITDANEATVKLTDVPRDQLIGTSFSLYFTDSEKAEEIYQKVFTEGMAMDYPLTLRHRDAGETRTEVLYNASVYRDASGKGHRRFRRRPRRDQSDTGPAGSGPKASYGSGSVS